jgi:UDP-N-acetylglucosamine diphosphorylase/glucosamine-1-phosphate N-acetyltransferase
MQVPPIVTCDLGLDGFGPLADLRPPSDFRSGVFTTAERFSHALGRPIVARIVPAELAPTVSERSPVPVNALPGGEDFLLIDASCPIHAIGCRAEADLPPRGAISLGGRIVAARCGRADLTRLLEHGPEAFASGLEIATVPDAVAIDRPWKILDRLGATISADIEHLLARAASLGLEAGSARIRAAGGATMGDAPILAHASASIAPFCCVDASGGPVLIGPKVTLRPFSTLVGPCCILDGSIVAERAVIKANTSIGPGCRIGGEVGGTIFQAFSNKAHDGHLGDSIVGEWVNLGAGTDNSNLLNTYGEVTVRLAASRPRERTGRIFCGSFLADHAKLAIGTRLMTGTSVGTGAMIASSASPDTTVDRFAWITDSTDDSTTGDGVRRFRLAKFLDVVRTVMARRGVTPGPAYLARLSALHGGDGA